jgi:hypothetical protein
VGLSQLIPEETTGSHYYHPNSPPES